MAKDRSTTAREKRPVREGDLYSTYPPYATWAVHLGNDGWIYAECVAARDYDPVHNEHDDRRLRQISGEYTGRKWMEIVRHGIAAKGGAIHYTLDRSPEPPTPIVHSMIDFMADTFASEGLETHLKYDPILEPQQHDDDEDLTVLMRKARDGDVEWVEDLIARGADMEAEDNMGCTALMHATYAGQLEVIKRLLKAGADANALTKRLRTALMIALELRTDTDNRFDVVRTLLKLGAEPNICEGGYTALDMCWRLDPRMTALLREFGGKRYKELIPLYQRWWIKYPALVLVCGAVAWFFWWLLGWAYGI